MQGTRTLGLQLQIFAINQQLHIPEVMTFQCICEVLTSLPDLFKILGSYEVLQQLGSGFVINL
jgi:hypothetical protein